MNEPKMKIGYGLFGRTYKHMFRNDLHHNQSIDHEYIRSKS